MSPLRAQTVQFVWFTGSAAEIDAEAVFRAVWGRDPDTTQKNRIPSANLPFLTSCAGDRDGWTAVAQTQPGRLDVVLSPSDQSDSPPWELDLLETEEVVQSVARAIRDNGLFFQNVNRQAIVLNVSKKTENYADAAELIYNLSGFNPSFLDVSDLEIKLNRRDRIGPDKDVYVNRIMRYNVTAFQTISFSPDGYNIGNAHRDALSYAANLNIDVNLVPTGGLFADDIQKTNWEAISTEAIRIATSSRLDVLSEVDR